MNFSRVPQSAARQAFSSAASKRAPMNQREEIYRRLLLRQRRRYAESGRSWPGKPEAAGTATLYPNLLAELDACGETLDKLAGYARVSPEILAAALDDGEELSVREIRRIAYNLGRCPERYLSDRKLQLVDPERPRGKQLARRLMAAIQAAEGLTVEHARQIGRVREALERGEPVTYRH